MWHVVFAVRVFCVMWMRHVGEWMRFKERERHSYTKRLLCLIEFSLNCYRLATNWMRRINDTQISRIDWHKRGSKNKEEKVAKRSAEFHNVKMVNISICRTHDFGCTVHNIDAERKHCGRVRRTLTLDPGADVNVDIPKTAVDLKASLIHSLNRPNHINRPTCTRHSLAHTESVELR